MNWSDVAQVITDARNDTTYGTRNIALYTNRIYDAMQELRSENARLAQELKLALLSK